MYDFSKLKGRIIEKYKTLGDFADVCQFSRQYLSILLSGNKAIGTKNMKLFIDLLEIPMDEVGLYFFTEKVQ